MRLTISCNAFKSLTINDVDVSSFNYYGTTEGYDYNDNESYNSIGFSLNDTTKTQEVYDYIVSQFDLNTETCKIEDYVTLRTKFEEYVSDKRPRISVHFRNGQRGWANPPQFNFKN